MRIGHLAKWSVLVLMVVAALTPVRTQAQSKATTATQFYMEYVVAFDKAKKIDDVMAYMAAENRKQIEATPAGEREKMFGMIKMFGHTDVKVLKESKAADGSTTLSVEGIDSDKQKSTGTVTIVKENGAFKLGKESWTTKASH